MTFLRELLHELSEIQMNNYKGEEFGLESFQDGKGALAVFCFVFLVLLLVSKCIQEPLPVKHLVTTDISALCITLKIKLRALLLSTVLVLMRGNTQYA